MKKFLVTLALTAMCALGFTACGNAEQTNPEDVLTLETGEYVASALYEQFDGIYQEYTLAEIEKQVGTGADMKTFLADLTSYYGAVDEMGSITGVKSGSVRVSGTNTDGTIFFVLEGAKRDADVEVYMTEDTESYPEMMISPQYTLGEKMEKAGLNTLLGMGTVFAVLILIMAIISCFSVFPKIEKALADKKANKDKTEAAAGVDNAVAQIIENEELSDDTELVAVIAAAIAAYEGSASTDGFVVRSIKRANTNKWQKA